MLDSCEGGFLGRARKKVPSGGPGQGDFPAEQATFKAHFANGQGSRQPSTTEIFKWEEQEVAPTSKMQELLAQRPSWNSRFFLALFEAIVPTTLFVVVVTGRMHRIISSSHQKEVFQPAGCKAYSPETRRLTQDHEDLSWQSLYKKKKNIFF